MKEAKAYLDLVRRLDASQIARSENDLSTRLARVLEALGLHPVIDTAGGDDRVKRPDILAYVEETDADLVVAADIVIESKKPDELRSFRKLRDALKSKEIWESKFIPYVRAHAERISFFVLTTFNRFLVVPLTAHQNRLLSLAGAETNAALKAKIVRGALEFDLESDGEAWRDWISTHFAPRVIAPPRLSEILNLKPLRGFDDLNVFAEELANVVAGRTGAGDGSSLVSTIDLTASRLDDLPTDVAGALTIYTISQHPGLTVEAAREFLDTHITSEMRGFVAASIHSIVGRLFAFKMIEDCFCVDVDPPLLPRPLWLFHGTRFDECPRERLAESIFAAMGAVGSLDVPALRDLASTGRFYDWIIVRLDPIAFRRLLTCFWKNNLRELDGDLLGRFFEIYAQRIDHDRRRELGQYYTPQAIVAYMWQCAIEIAKERKALNSLVVLDPGVGSGTFLCEGARRLQREGIGRYWERLFGFDIAPQVIGVAYVNLYLTILGLSTRVEAQEVSALQLYPTDALDPQNGRRLRAILPLVAGDAYRNFLQNRILLGEDVKRRSRFELVIGNPPYRNNSERTLSQVATHFPAMLSTSRANAAARDRNIRDDYAWFFAAADYYITERGVIAFVVSDSFCTAQSYHFFRIDLLRRYHIRQLVHLGYHIFRDVGPRISFVIIVLERRRNILAEPDPTEAISYVDLRPLVQGLDTGLGTPEDPRLQMLARAATGDRHGWPNAVNHQPNSARDFGLFPAGEIVARVNRAGPPAHGRKGNRVFLTKWPGFITAFDELYKSADQTKLQERMQRFFRASAMAPARRRVALTELANEISADPVRLTGLADQAREKGFDFDPQRIKRTLTGTAPNDARWYPDARLRSWVYFEPRLNVPRNVHEGRDPGWGTMSQWREPETHDISPKLVFTTASHTRHGLKAFVVADDWLVKLHGGTRQQFHYTGVANPLKQPRLDGLPNNLGEEAATLFESFADTPQRKEHFLLYVAAIYNSRVAEHYLGEGGGDTLSIPCRPNPLTAGIVSDARQLRNLHWLLAVIDDGGPLEPTWIEGLFTREQITELALRRRAAAGGRFRGIESYVASERVRPNVQNRIDELQQALEISVERLFAD